MPSLPLDLTPPVLLAPMAGITDVPFRAMVSGFGAGLVTSEMVASRDMVCNGAAAIGRSRAEGGAVQIAGCDPYWMAEAARRVEDAGARLVDINMGCPARKVVGGASGSALLRDLDHALAIVDAVTAAVGIPVTLKTRLGWDEATLNASDLARRAEASGIAMITIHGRTRCQFYRGRANWRAVRRIRDEVDIPVIVNGDIVDPDTARGALRASGADGTMIGRGARGRPWILARIAAALYGMPAPVVPQGPALADLAARHVDASCRFYGRDLGARVVRKHLGWYMDHAGTPPALRREILTTPAHTIRGGLLAMAFDRRELAA